jgi:phosphoserine phosphatase
MSSPSETARVHSLLAALEAALAEHGPGALAFDADGTLWSGDVGEDVFLYAIEHGLLRVEALPALQALAQAHDIQVSREANAQARLLYDAFRGHTLPELAACEMMAWGFAGWSDAELDTQVARILDAAQLSQRYYGPMLRVQAWAKERGLPCYVVSASPDFVIRVATTPLGFEPAHLAACTPVRTSNGLLLPHLATPLPYLDHKVLALQRLAPSRALLAAFGDNGFDLPLLQAARLAVAVRPKPALSNALNQLPHALILQND